MKYGTIEDFVRDMDAGVFDFTENGKCICCGNCCTNLLPMSKREIKLVRDYIKNHNIKEQKRFVPSVNPTYDMTCPFMDSSKDFKCTIYKVRPKICRDFNCHSAKAGNFKANEKMEPIDVRSTFFGALSISEMMIKEMECE